MARRRQGEDFMRGGGTGKASEFADFEELQRGGITRGRSIEGTKGQQGPQRRELSLSLFCALDKRGGVCVSQLCYIVCSYLALLWQIDSIFCGTMLIRWNRFNINLLAAIVLVCVCGCQTAAHKRKKQV